MKKQFPLVSKIYLCEFLSAMVFWVVGWLMLTPPWNPPIAKYLMLGSMIVVLLVLVIVLLVKPSEKIDDRAKSNLFFAAFFTLALLGIVLLIGIIPLIILGGFMLKISHLLFVLAFILSVHAILFYVYDRSGR